MVCKKELLALFLISSSLKILFHLKNILKNKEEDWCHQHLPKLFLNQLRNYLSFAAPGYRGNIGFPYEFLPDGGQFVAEWLSIRLRGFPAEKPRSP